MISRIEHVETQGAANQFEMWCEESLFLLVLIERETLLTTFQIGLQLPVCQNDFLIGQNVSQ